MDSTGFDSSIMLFVRGGILMTIGDSPEDLTQAMLVGIMLVGIIIIIIVIISSSIIIGRLGV